MTDPNDGQLNRRAVLRAVGGAGLALGGLAVPASARPGGRQALPATPMDVAVYWSTTLDDGRDQWAPDPNQLSEFQFPAEPFIEGSDLQDGRGMFAASDLEITPNERTVHTTLRLFGGLLLSGEPGRESKPLVLVKEGEGYFESRGHVVTFEAPSRDQIAQWLDRAGIPAWIADEPPMRLLADRSWRAVGNERLVLDSEDPERTPEFVVRRVDFYDREGSEPEYSLSLQFVMWRADDDRRRSAAMIHAMHMIHEGRLNPGGQSRGSPWDWLGSPGSSGRGKGGGRGRGRDRGRGRGRDSLW